MLSRLLILVAFLVILGVPLGVKLTQREVAPPANARRLVIVTPHVPQIRREFGEAFAAWHQREFGEPAFVDWRSPGAGTTEIIKILGAQFTAAAKEGKFDFSDPKNPTAPKGTIAFDMMFGGGSFDHNRLKTDLKIKLASPDGAKDEQGNPLQVELALPMSAPAGFTQEQLDAWFGENAVGAELLYDPNQYWLGTALSGFGIVFNRDRFRELGLSTPRGFADLTSPKLQGELILADPRQSGSVTTAIDSILNAELWVTARREGWESELDTAFKQERADKTPWEQSLSKERMASVDQAFDRAWRSLREITANARAYTAAATRPPIDVSAGEGAAGIAIDFYGRSQAQSLVHAGEDPNSSRVGYVDPEGAAYIDADPASILRAGPDPELAKRFLTFSLSEEGQALWQFLSVRSLDSMQTKGENPPRPKDEAGHALGPANYELRRLPVRRVMYDKYLPHFIDRINPFDIASGNRPAGWRAALGVMIGAFSIDVLEDQREAWRALNLARSANKAANAGIDDATLAQMEHAFYAFPKTTGKDGTALPFTGSNFRQIREAWRPMSTKDRATLPASYRTMSELEVDYTNFFRKQYREVVRLWDSRSKT